MTLAELRRALEALPPGTALTLPREALLDALNNGTAAADERRADLEAAEAWLTAEQCAERLNVSVRWCYDHAAQIGGKKLSRRCVRFSSRAVARYLSRRTG